MFKLTRLWDIDNYDLEPDIEILYKRPRVDYRISEYIFDYINKNILEQNKIMQTGNYTICLSFAFYYKNEQKYFDDNIYNTENTKYDFQEGTSTENGIKYKDIWIGCYSIDLNEKIKPIEYAHIVYDMIGSFLVNKYKKITKGIMDKNKTGIDYKLIESYKYPALFEEQKYVLDDEAEGTFIIKNETIDVSKEYKKHYKE
jgi:hypothetical protein